jgi:hypothetical protein
LQTETLLLFTSLKKELGKESQVVFELMKERPISQYIFNFKIFTLTVLKMIILKNGKQATQKTEKSNKLIEFETI